MLARLPHQGKTEGVSLNQRVSATIPEDLWRSSTGRFRPRPK